MSQKGIVGFFDILGYQNVVNNNQVEYVAELITETLYRLPKKVTGKISTLLGDSKYNDEISRGLENIKYIIVSDSILVFMTIDDGMDVDDLHNNITIYLTFVAQFLRLTFDSGLPLRGAIDYGDYYIHDHTFAGKPIINSYSFSNKLEFSGALLLDGFDNFLNTCLMEDSDATLKSNCDMLLINYLVSLKNEEIKAKIINWYNPIDHKSWGTQAKDIRQYIFDSFHKHNKDIPCDVMQKINNTEKMIRYFISNSKK